MTAEKTREAQTMQEKSDWLLCPLCGGKTRLKVRGDTEIRHFPLYCPRCRRETLINFKQHKIFVIQEPDA